MSIKEKMDSIKILFTEFNEYPITFRPIYRKITGNTNAAVLLSQLMYWYAKMGRVFYKVDKELIEELCISPKEFKTAKSLLQELGLIIVSHGEANGKSRVSHYQIDLDKLLELIVKHGRQSDSDSRLSPNRPNDGASSVRIGLTITETTNTETTTDIYCAFDNALSPCLIPNIEREEGIENDAISPAAYESFRTLEDTSEPSIEILDEDPAAYETLRTLDKKDDGFDKIWDLYGFKRNKPDAEKAYRKLSEKEKAGLAAGIESYLAYLKHPHNSWRQQKQLGAFIRGAMWNDDWSLDKTPEITEPLGEHEKGYMAMRDWTLKNYPNVFQLEWLNKEEYLAVKKREPDFCGQYWRIKATENELKSLIVDALRELNENAFVRKNHTRVYTYLRDTIKKKLYA